MTLRESKREREGEGGQRRWNVLFVISVEEEEEGEVRVGTLE